MKRSIAALLAVGLSVSSVTAFAQSGYDRYGNGDYDSRDSETYYDYARVIRVDPALGGDYRSEPAYGGQRCYETTTAGRYERDGYYRNDGYYGGGYDGYGRRPQGTEAGRNVATIVGGIAGAVLGSKMGGGSGRYAATAVGSMVGSMAGRGIYEQTQRDRYVRPASVRVCDPEPVAGGYRDYDGYRTASANAYDVTYEYNGRQYTRRMDYHPGDRVRVRVDVSPE